MGETSSSPTIATQLQRIAEQAKRYPEMVFTTLAHLIDVDFLREAYRRTRKDSAPGIDGVTAEQYAEHLEENVRDLHERAARLWLAVAVATLWLLRVGGEAEDAIPPSTFLDLTEALDRARRQQRATRLRKVES